LKTRETVETETPLSFATSWMVLVVLVVTSGNVFGAGR
jgi:hypothetical protein